jgi:ubiquinone/menaquinone biosynthesis C-methylase UbiE
MVNNNTCKEWNNKEYVKHGFKAQRLYPNEELCRFMGRNFFHLSNSQRKHIRILELGCGTCANIWMIAKEGFDAHGIDFSAQAIKLGGMMLDKWGASAKLKVMDMTKLDYKDEYFDAVVDVFASYCLREDAFSRCLSEVRRVLKKGGLFFSYTPSVDSDAFINFKPSVKLDRWTIDGIKRKDAPYFNNDFPFRFTSPAEYQRLLKKQKFSIEYLETVSKTYRQMQEKFEFVIITGKK